MTTSDIHIQASEGPAYMQPADFLPFTGRLLQLAEQETQAYISRVLTHEPYRGFNQAEREAKRIGLTAHLRRTRAMYGFVQHHYPVGAVFDYIGVPAMVETSDYSYVDPRGRQLVIGAAYKDVAGGLQHLFMPEELALALVWRKFGLEAA